MRAKLLCTLENAMHKAMKLKQYSASKSMSNKTTLLSPDKYLKETLVKSLPLLFLPSTLHPCPTWLFK